MMPRQYLLAMLYGHTGNELFYCVWFLKLGTTVELPVILFKRGNFERVGSFKSDHCQKFLTDLTSSNFTVSLLIFKCS